MAVATAVPPADPYFAPETAAYGLYTKWGSGSNPPWELDAEFRTGAEHLMHSLDKCHWLFPPGENKSEPSSRGASRTAHQPGEADDEAAAAAMQRGEVSVSSSVREEIPFQYEERPGQYEFKYLKSEIAKKVIWDFLIPCYIQEPGAAPLAMRFSNALKRFAANAYTKLTTMSPTGGPLIPEDERQRFMDEALLAMDHLVMNKVLNVATDLNLSLEAFGVSKGHPDSEQNWLSSCIEHLLTRALLAAGRQDQARWKETSRGRIIHEATELYSCIDVRAWPHILRLTEVDPACVDGSSFKRQVQLQLCTGGQSRQWYTGLQQAAQLVADLHQVSNFAPEEIYEIFNDKDHFDRHQRQHLLTSVLRGAPKLTIQQVLRKIDGEDVDVAERDDEEIILVRDLIRLLGEDIRCCKHAFFKMKSDWIAGRWSGVVVNEELSADQVCDHIEDEDNHEELLKVAVNYCLRKNRKFEAAKMLARKASKGTRVYETNRNDKQLGYLVSLYSEVEAPVDRFAPVEESCLVLPCEANEVLLVESTGEALHTLQQETLESKVPMAIGVWWFWRCFDPKLDSCPRASFIALAYRGRFVIVDLVRLETTHGERAGKDVLRKIFSAGHILKVVHDMDKLALDVLQHGLTPHEDLVSDEQRPPPVISPLLDVTMPGAFVRRTRPAAAPVAKLTGLIWDYLRLEFCLAEALSNFERRPLRKTQQHYALTLAWCPLMILNILVAKKILTIDEVLAMTLRVGQPGMPPKWDDEKRGLYLHSDTAVADEVGEDGDFLHGAPYDKNIWEDDQWCSMFKPDRNFPLEGVIKSRLPALIPPPDHVQATRQCIESLASPTELKEDLDALYERFHEFKSQQQ